MRRSAPDAVGDDLTVEAPLAEFPDGLSRDDLAGAFGWSLGRVERALLGLEQRLVPTGRRLRLIGWHRYALGPNLAVLSAAERGRLVRSAAHGRLPYEVIEALYQIVSGWDLITMFGRGVDHAAVESLIDHGLLEPERVRLKLSPDVVFSLRLDDH